MIARIYLLALYCAAPALFTGCRKDVPDTTPPINGYRAYDRMTVEVKADPAGGHVLLCKSTPIERRTAFLQFMDVAGELRNRIAFDQFPMSVENIVFGPDERWYTDFLPHPDGSFYVLGLARQAQPGDRIHLIVHHIERNGTRIEAPFRRFIVDGGVMVTEIDGPRQDIDGLPRSRALGALIGADLVIAVRWETAGAAGIRLYRFPTGNSSSTTLQAELVLPEATDRLYALASDPAAGEVVLAFENGTTNDDHRVVIQKFVADNTYWTGLPGIELGTGNFMLNAEPQQLQWVNGSYLMIGNQPQENDLNLIKPFVTHFNDVAEVNSNMRILDGLAAADRPVATYCANRWNGGVTLIVQIHEASALQPFFDGDITSDLMLADLSWPSLTPVGSLTIIPGQGLRGSGLFVSDGERVIIGSQQAYLNTAVIHTFRAAID